MLSRRSCSTGSSVDAVCASMAWVMTSSPTRLMIWSILHADADGSRFSSAGSGRRARARGAGLGDGFGSGGRRPWRAAGAGATAAGAGAWACAARRTARPPAAELLRAGWRRCARSRLRRDVQLIGVDDEAADRLDIVGRAGAVDPDGRAGMARFAGAHLTQVAHFSSRASASVRHLLVMRTRRPAAVARRRGCRRFRGWLALGGGGAPRCRGLRGSRRIHAPVRPAASVPRRCALNTRRSFEARQVRLAFEHALRFKNMSTMSVRSVSAATDRPEGLRCRPASEAADGRRAAFDRVGGPKMALSC